MQLHTHFLATTALGLALMSPGSALAQDAASDEEAYANPDLLVTTDWVAEHAADAAVTLVDVRSASDYAAGHIAGALNIPTSATFDPEAPGDIGKPEHVAELLGSLGVKATDRVVLYDEGKSTSAARFFWTLEVYGHASLSVVNGGYGRWQAEKRETSKLVTKKEPTRYVINSVPGRLSDVEEVLEGIEDPDVVRLDSRSSGEYTNGRLPGAVRIEWTQTFTDEKAPGFLAPGALAKLYQDQGVTREKRVHAY